MKRYFITLALAASMLAAARSQERLPNVVIILADDLGYGDLACYGAKNVETPAIDSLARQGARFTDVHAVAATSTPSRYSLLTGEYAWRKPGTDVAPGNAGMIINPATYTMADMFRHRGYAPAAIGKWHLGLGERTGEQDWNAPLSSTPRDLGFDYHYIMAATADRVPCVFIEQDTVANRDFTAPIYVNYRQNYEGEPTGKDNPELLYNQRPSHGHDMSIINGISRIGFSKGGGTALWKDENIADSITAHAVRFIEENADKPFFVYFATNDVHVPRFPHDRFRGQNPMGVRGDAIVEFDWSVQQILAALDSAGVADNTIVILTSDNGPVVDDGYDDRAEELLNGHSPAGPLRGNKYSSFEGGTAVPFIVRWPGKVAPDTESEALISLADLFRSLGTVIGANIPLQAAPDSEDQSVALTGAKVAGREYLPEMSNSHVLSARSGKWKYITPSDGPKMIPWGPKIETGNSLEPQLYDLSADRGEQVNVAAENPEVVARMKAYVETLTEKK